MGEFWHDDRRDQFCLLKVDELDEHEGRENWWAPRGLKKRKIWWMLTWKIAKKSKMATGFGNFLGSASNRPLSVAISSSESLNPGWIVLSSLLHDIPLDYHISIANYRQVLVVIIFLPQEELISRDEATFVDSVVDLEHSFFDVDRIVNWHDFDHSFRFWSRSFSLPLNPVSLRCCESTTPIITRDSVLSRGPEDKWN